MEQKTTRQNYYPLISSALKTYYLDYLNNFLTIKRFSEYYDMTEEKAEKVIMLGYKLYNKGK